MASALRPAKDAVSVLLHTLNRLVVRRRSALEPAADQEISCLGSSESSIEMSDQRTLYGVVVIPDSTRVSEIGARRAIMYLAPFLRQKGVVLRFVSNHSLRHLATSVMRLVRQGDFQSHFLMFNALGSLKSPWARLLYQAARFLRKPVIVYWRELQMQFQALSPQQVKRVDSIARQAPVIHLSNSQATKNCVAARYAGVHPINALNCAFVDHSLSHEVCYPTVSPQTVVGMGSPSVIKGTDFFLSTAIEVCRKNALAEFIWIGRGNPLPEWLDEISSNGLEGRIVFSGAVEVPALFLRRASVFFMASREESFSQATAEAMFLARQVVTFENGGPPEILDKHGIVVPGFDPVAAARVILGLLKRCPDELMNLGARQRYLDHFTPKVHAARLAAIIRRCLAERASGPSPAPEPAKINHCMHPPLDETQY